jgi:protein-S-isoprenylcysteine O-methyltransferase Ste14
MGPLLRASLYIALFLALLSLGSNQLLTGLGVSRPSPAGVAQVAGAALVVAGALLALTCVFVFARRGRGTPVPLDPPRRLVVSGPYRFVRNPMAIGVGSALAGVALFYQSAQFLVAVVVFMLGIHAMIWLYEEPTLRRTFGPEYDAYCGRVNRWIPRFGARRDPT